MVFFAALHIPNDIANNIRKYLSKDNLLNNNLNELRFREVNNKLNSRTTCFPFELDNFLIGKTIHTKTSMFVHLLKEKSTEDKKDYLSKAMGSQRYKMPLPDSSRTANHITPIAWATL